MRRERMTTLPASPRSLRWRGVMSKEKWDATLVFIAVAGEEQGLFGSTHWAKMAKEKNWDVAGMITNDIIGSSRGDDGHLDDTHVRLFAEGVPPTREMSDAERKLVATGGENDSRAARAGALCQDDGRPLRSRT